MTEFVFNASVSVFTALSPFFVNHKWEPKMNFESMKIDKFARKKISKKSNEHSKKMKNI